MIGKRTRNQLSQDSTEQSPQTKTNYKRVCQEPVDNIDELIKNISPDAANLTLAIETVQKPAEAEVNDFKAKLTDSHLSPEDLKYRNENAEALLMLYKIVTEKFQGFRETVAEQRWADPSLTKLFENPRQTYEKYLYRYEKTHNEPTKFRLDPQTDKVSID